MIFWVLEFHAAWDLVEVICYFLFLSAFLTPRKKFFPAAAAVLVTWALMLLNRDHKALLGVYSWILPVCLVIAESWLVYRGKWGLRVLAAVTCYLLFGIIDNIAVYSVSMVLGISFGALTWLNETYLITMSAAKLAELLLSLLIHRVIRRADLAHVQNKWILLALLFPLTSAAMPSIIYFYSMNSTFLSFPTVVFSLILGAANTAVLFIIYSLEKSTRHAQELELLRQQISFQKSNFESLENSYRTQRSAVHEFERHLRVLTGLVEANEVQEARTYLRKLTANRSLHVFCVSSRHPVMDVILNQKYQMAQEQNIRMHIEVNDLSAVEIQTDYLVVLLSNLLDNAMEACMRLPDNRQILCRILAENGLYISVRNTSLPVEIADGKVVTRKDDCREHGYGLPAICYVLDNMQADYIFDYQDGWFQFVAEIPMQTGTVPTALKA